VLCSMLACFLWGGLPLISRDKVDHWKPWYPQVHDINAVATALPPNAVVSATDFLVAHVDHRERAYQFPTPFRALYWGLLNQEGERLPFANQVQYLFLLVHMNPTDQAVFNQIRSQFVVVKRVGYAELLKRRGT